VVLDHRKLITRCATVVSLFSQRSLQAGGGLPKARSLWTENDRACLRGEPALQEIQ